jgi:predicted RNA-binding Zn-ribbon protein involved in translation (DUF1610 family)
MSDNPKASNLEKTSAIEKICHDTDCCEKIAELPQDVQSEFKRFIYCPFCAEELTLICQHCREQLNSTEYKFCPWCGVKFEDGPEPK